MTLTPAQNAVLNAIDESALVAELVNLIRVPSVTGTDAESELQHRSAAQLTELGLDVDLWKINLEELAADPRFPGSEAERLEGYGVVGVTGPGVPALVLQGHVDVVPIGDETKWTEDPFSGEIIGGALHGRGACDMKAGVATNLAVIRAIYASGVTLERPLALHTVVSEEDGGLGAFATLLRGHTGDAAVIPEPTSGRIITANAGALTFELTVAGRAAHGSARLEGVSAFDAFLPINAAIFELEARRNENPDPLFAGNPLPYPIAIGTLQAGDWSSSVPDRLTAHGRYGVRLDEDPDVARAEFAEAIAAACAKDAWLRDNPVQIKWDGGQFNSGRIPQGHELIAQMSDAVVAIGGFAPDQAAAPYGSDLRLYNSIGGIPTLHYGPGDVRMAHAPREQVDIAEVIRVTRALAVLAVQRCGAHL
ncbi:ArgE/DapE family deacylase [Nakamurella antarctica]|uniref:ArgE/DapE family deacylase n=1 Tax=Nakamurella antarctica TaxID=1902245 RepID=A0A3G8ZML8_9ACTN|nr:ArgE/DapE family deacylase [Nakamurella antarctica]AZI58592.1 ArgE/DapE family deacylase [Nakamurella antarctica]